MPERFLGRTLGRYRVEALAGAGGFAWVYRAFDPELEIPLALKVLKPQYSGDEKFEERFRREASTAAKLRHPNIIKIYSVGREGEAVYFAMDYLPNGLSDRLEVMGTLPEPMLIRMAMDVAGALAFAHRQGVIHRDVKTDNILFDDHGNAVVADFGIARAVSGYTGHTATNMVVGTPQYFSPEQARGHKLDGRADIYSLGVTLFRAATGSLPFTGEDWYEIARQQVEEPPPKPRAVNPSVSRGLEAIILRCLEKKASDRFQSGDELCRELDALLQQRGESSAYRSFALPAGDTVETPSFDSGSGPRAAAAARVAHERTRALWVAAGGGIVLVATLVLAQRSMDHAVPASAAPAPVDSETPIRSASSSVVPPSVGDRPASTPPTAAVPNPPRRVTVHAPSDAVITVNGTRVGLGTWTAETLKPGRYEIAATLRPMPGCGSTMARQTLVLNEPGSRDVRLAPRPCGTLTLDARPSPATYTLYSIADDRTVEGRTPVDKPLVVPAGQYRITVERPYCAPYQHQFRVYADRPNEPVRVRLICD